MDVTVFCLWAFWNMNWLYNSKLVFLLAYSFSFTLGIVDKKNFDPWLYLIDSNVHRYQNWKIKMKKKKKINDGTNTFFICVMHLFFSLLISFKEILQAIEIFIVFTFIMHRLKNKLKCQHRWGKSAAIGSFIAAAAAFGYVNIYVTSTHPEN